MVKECGAVGGTIISKSNWSTRRKIKYVQVSLRHPKSHKIWLGSNPGYRVGKPSIAHLSCGTAIINISLYKIMVTFLKFILTSDNLSIFSVNFVAVGLFFCV
jgi:hypothetical protein